MYARPVSTIFAVSLAVHCHLDPILSGKTQHSAEDKPARRRRLLKGANVKGVVASQF
jgi:hypothetical protein